MTGASFASDNHAGVHPEVMAAIIAANEGFVPAYGDDPITARATDLLRAEFGSDIGVFPVFNGTGANVVALSGLLRPYEAVVCTSNAHINVDECGAPERFTGAKLLDVEPVDGKLTIAGIESMVWGIGDPKGAPCGPTDPKGPPRHARQRRSARWEALVSCRPQPVRQRCDGDAGDACGENRCKNRYAGNGEQSIANRDVFETQHGC